MATIDVFAKIFDEKGRILCVKRSYGAKSWSTPGGLVEPNESPIAALERETIEETGYKIRVKKLLGVYAKTYKDEIVLSFLAEITGKEKNWKPDGEISEIKFFAKNELPKPMTFATQKRIEDSFSKNPGVVRVLPKADVLLESVE